MLVIFSVLLAAHALSFCGASVTRRNVPLMLASEPGGMFFFLVGLHFSRDVLSALGRYYRWGGLLSSVGIGFVALCGFSYFAEGNPDIATATFSLKWLPQSFCGIFLVCATAKMVVHFLMSGKDLYSVESIVWECLRWNYRWRHVARVCLDGVSIYGLSRLPWGTPIFFLSGPVGS